MRLSLHPSVNKALFLKRKQSIILDINKSFKGLKKCKSCACSAPGGVPHHITAGSRHLANMNAVVTQREPAKRYAKWCLHVSLKSLSARHVI